MAVVNTRRMQLCNQSWTWEINRSGSAIYNYHNMCHFNKATMQLFIIILCNAVAYAKPNTPCSCKIKNLHCQNSIFYGILSEHLWHKGACDDNQTVSLDASTAVTFFKGLCS